VVREAKWPRSTACVCEAETCDRWPVSTSTDPASTPSSTRATLARLSARGYTVIRNIFVQVSTSKGRYAGSSLGHLVAARQPRALRAYLLLLMSWSAIGRRPEPLDAAVWARALSPDPPAAPWAASAMTRVWNTLEEHRLVSKERQGRRVKLGLRREDGRTAYTRPRPDESRSRRERFFILPDAFWLEGWHERLSFPGVALMLILLAETTGREEVALPIDRASGWYGISRETCWAGLEDLRRNGLLQERQEWVTEDLSPIGKKRKTYYRLATPFSRAERQKLQRVAAHETQKRAAPPSIKVRRRPATTAGKEA
jgi:hypothetical protein